MTRLIDRLLSRASDGNPGYGEFMASGAAVTIADYTAGRSERTPAEFVTRARHAYESNGVVYSCIRARMDLFSEATFKWQALQDRRIFGTQGLEILEYPWPNGTSGELLSRMEQDVSTAGNFYGWRAEDDLIIRLPPEWMTIVTELRTDDLGREYRVPIGYFYDPRLGGRHDEEPKWLDVDEVAHFSPEPDPIASWRGMSWLTPVLREVFADNSLTEYKIAHLANGAMPSLVLRYSQKLAEPTVNALRQRFAAKFAGPANAGKTIVLDEGADMTVVGGSLDQLQFAAVQGAGETRIAMASGVPPELAGLMEAQSYDQSMRKFADMWARPQWRRACACLQRLVSPPPQGSRLWYDTSDIAALQDGELQRGQALLVRVQAMQSAVSAGYERKSVIAAINSGDLSQLVPDPSAPPSGVTDRVTETEKLAVGAPKGALAQMQPGVVRPALPATTVAVGNGVPNATGNGRGPGGGGGGH